MKLAVPTRSELRVEAYRFPPWAVILIALLALWLQGYLPLWFPTASVLDLPLLVTVYFALSRRSQISGMLVGAAIGLAQDSLGHGPIGLFGMVKTVVGYAASSLSARIDTEHPGIRLVVVFVFYYIHLGLFLLLQQVLLQKAVSMPGVRSLAVALINAILAVLLFKLMDRLRKPV